MDFTDNKKEVGGTQSIGRATEILRVIAASDGMGFGLGEIAERSGIERPTVHRILRRLTAESILVQNPMTRNYHLGPLLYELGLAASSSVPAQQLCKEALQELSSITGDSTFLTVRSGQDVVCLDRSEGHFPIRVLNLGVGQRRPLGCGAGSIALLSTLADDQVEKILLKNTPLLAARGEPSITEFLQIVKQARQQGYAIKDAPDLPVRSLSMPVRDAYGIGVCALSVSTLTVRVEQNHDKMVAALKRITETLALKIRGTIMFN